MVNFFTTIVGIFTRLTQLTIALALLLIFSLWLTVRDLYYGVCHPLFPILLTAQS